MIKAIKFLTILSVLFLSSPSYSEAPNSLKIHLDIAALKLNKAQDINPWDLLFKIRTAKERARLEDDRKKIEKLFSNFLSENPYFYKLITPALHDRKLTLDGLMSLSYKKFSLLISELAIVSRFSKERIDLNEIVHDQLINTFYSFNRSLDSMHRSWLYLAWSPYHSTRLLRNYLSLRKRLIFLEGLITQYPNSKRTNIYLEEVNLTKKSIAIYQNDSAFQDLVEPVIFTRQGLLISDLDTLTIDELSHLLSGLRENHFLVHEPFLGLEKINKDKKDKKELISKKKQNRRLNLVNLQLMKNENKKLENLYNLNAEHLNRLEIAEKALSEGLNSCGDRLSLPKDED